jgi:hypothetical protein
MVDKREDFRAVLADGKYTYIRYSDGSQKVLRHNEEWPAKDASIVGDSFLAEFGYALEDAIKRLGERS